MKYLRYVLITLAVLIVGYVALCFAGPKDFNISRSVEADATPEAVFTQINNFKNWENWSPWYMREKTMTITYGDTIEGKGADYAWESKKNGAGNMRILESDPSKHLKIQLQFKGWSGNSYANFDIESLANNRSKITWGMDSAPLPFIVRGLMAILGAKGNMTKDFDDGLKNLAAAAAKAPVAATSYAVKELTFPATTYVILRKEIGFDAIATFIQAEMPKIGAAAGASMKGYPATIYFKYDEVNKKTDMAVAIPVAAGTKAPAGYTTVDVKSSTAWKVDYYGEYDKTMGAYEALSKATNEKGVPEPAYALEEYVTDPTTVNGDWSKVLTQIYFIK